MKCENPECGKEFVQRRAWQRFCCRRCADRALWLTKVKDGRAAAENDAKRARRNAGKVKRPRRRRGLLDSERAREIEWEMEQPREELLKYSEKWTKEERKLAKKIYMQKHRLFPCIFG